jgi:protein tyrosine phosphatase
MLGLKTAEMKQMIFKSRVYGILLSLMWLSACTGPKALPDACKIDLSPSITNGCIVTPGKLWRGGKPDAAGAQALVNLGVKTVVNLELLHDDRDAFRNAKPSSSHPSNIAYFRIRDWEPNVVIATGTLDEHVAEFIAITQSQLGPVYVHCRSGQNRTGVMVAAYRVLVENAPIETAITEMEQYQGVWFKQDAAYIRTLLSERRAAIVSLAKQRAKRVKHEAVLACTTAGCVDIQSN